MKKVYTTPQLTTEQLNIGVFGCYGSGGNGKAKKPPRGWWWFGWGWGW